MIVTEAPATAPPVWSVMAPYRRPRFNCAKAGTQKKNSARATPRAFATLRERPHSRLVGPDGLPFIDTVPCSLERTHRTVKPGSSDPEASWSRLIHLIGIVVKYFSSEA